MAYLTFDFFSLGWSASDRFLRHLPDFVLSRSFDHLPFLTSGTGKHSPSHCLLLFQPYILSRFKIMRKLIFAYTPIESYVCTQVPLRHRLDWRMKWNLGKVKTEQIKRVGKELIARFPEKFSSSFDENKLLVETLTKGTTTRIRNQIAGYITSKLGSSQTEETTEEPEEQT